MIFGTRPEAIKLAPLIVEFKKRPGVECRVCVTAQHRQMLDQVLEVFKITPDVDLGLMRSNQALAGLTARAIEAIDNYLARDKPDAVLVQGDTTTVMAGSLASFYHKISVGHVEAGLRTGNIMAPWPEEANRLITSRLAKWHFAPTEINRANLLREGIDDSSIYVTGNTVIDALFLALQRLQETQMVIKGLPPELCVCPARNNQSRKLVLITSHRRENYGAGFENICRAIAELATHFKEVDFVYPVHLNPNVREPVDRMIAGRGLHNIYVIQPLTYFEFVAVMNRATLILTDSGGVQEEAPSLGKPVLVLRETTERPEALATNNVKLVGTDYYRIVNEAHKILEGNVDRTTNRAVASPYGDGKSAKRIADVLLQSI